MSTANPYHMHTLYGARYKTMDHTYHHAPPDDSVGSTERNLGIGDLDHSFSCRVCNDVSEVTSMSVLISRPTVFLPSWVEVGPCTHTTLVECMRTSGRGERAVAMPL